MLRFLALRVLGGLATLLAASVIIFVATEVLPGDTATAVLGRDATPERVAALRESLGLSESAHQRYLDWIAGAITLDLGNSLTQNVAFSADGSRAVGAPVREIITRPVNNSAVLIALTLMVVIPLSVALGTLAALREGTRLDSGIQTVTLAASALPEFVLGAALIILFGFVWPVLPAVSFDVTPAALVLPVATLAAVSVAWVARLIRSGVIDVLRADHVALARLKGLPEALVIRRHVLPNAMAPALQAFAVITGYLAGGIVVVEFLFDYPGMGKGLVAAIRVQDVPVIQAYTLLLAGTYVVANIVADVLTIATNPRLRSSL
jgi:peptide/nickel transport system permease protein